MRRLGLVALLLAVAMVCLYATTGTIQFDYSVIRRQQGTVSDIYFADLNGNRLTSNSNFAIEMDKDFNQPQFLLAVRNNLAASDTARRVSLKFTSMVSTTDPTKKGSYIAAIWRYKAQTVDGKTWQDQSNLGSSSTLRATRDKCKIVPAGGSQTLEWGLDKTDMGETERVWYYAVSITFFGTCAVDHETDYQDYDFLSEYIPGMSYTGDVTITLKGN